MSSMADAVFIIHRINSKEWRWHLVAPDNTFIADSCRSYVTEDDCVGAIDAVKKYAPLAKILKK